MAPLPTEQQFQRWLEQHRGILFNVARTYCRDEDDRQDLLQEMLVQLWQALPRYDPARAAASTWVYRVALNTAISFHRRHVGRRAARVPLPPELPQPPDAEALEREQQLRQLEQFIDELRELDKALMLLYLENKSHADIADILGISVSNVATKVSRIKEQLRQRFARQTA
ncbi:RNA polymerase sigma factor [Hymenobacter jeollabukensis]|uniref:Sigma-70 family RNA polymerase sigma factor n=1 Tax=Hymenobacter jeollabukensis TaxID=2025313 RepID=A0A5R8WNU4_9BACT|nr:sigma-70 family RNA polymerase sigma factor [Hymenobacter jeollabukensis]TLM91113.1 sigma-70 family RNA polymerase sigma factor [Hymenobacter jeollabukensis]